MTKRIAYVTGGMGGIGTSISQRLHKDEAIRSSPAVAQFPPRRVKWLEEQKALWVSISSRPRATSAIGTQPKRRSTRSRLKSAR